MEKKTNLKVSLLSRLTDLVNIMSEQKIKLTSSLYELQKLEIKEHQSCHCKNFCQITHQKHNFVKPESKQLFSKLNSISALELTNVLHPKKFNRNECDLGAFTKKYTYNKYEAFFSEQSLLKKQKKHDFNENESENGEVKDSVQTGGLS